MVHRIVETIPAKPMAKHKVQERNKLRVAAYARVSTDSMEQLNSVEAQKDYFEKLIQKKPDWIFIGVYADEGISGTSLNRRAAFNQMITDALDGKIDMILTKSLSRFARNTVDALNTIRALKEKGVSIYFEKENIDTLDSKGEFLITLMSSLAEEESRSISENVKWGTRKRFSEGKYSLGYKMFLGYQKGENGTLVIDEKEACIVRQIYGMCIEGYSVGAIARSLTARGVPTVSGKTQWQKSVIHNILNNEKYYGAALLQKKFIPDYRTHKAKKNEGELPQYYIADDHEGIVTKELFDEAKRSREKIPTNKRRQKLFSNKLYCSECGSVYVPKLWHSTTYRNVVWMSQKAYENRNNCHSPHLYEEVLRQTFHSVIVEFLRRNKSIVKNCVETINSVCSEEDKTITRRVYNILNKAQIETDIERTVYWVVIDKVFVYPDYTLEFFMVDGTVIKHKIEDKYPKSNRLPETTKKQIYEDYKNGMKCSEIANKYRMRYERVRAIIARRRKKENTEE